jgi:hypothetical protein
MIHYLTLDGREMFTEYLEYWGRPLATSAIAVVPYEQLLTRTTLDPGVYVFTTFDEVEPSMRSFVEALAEQLGGWPGARIMNDPRRVLQRFELHAELSRLGRNQYRSWRPSDELSAMRYPLFVRAQGSHDGALSPLLDSPADVETWIGKAIALGRSPDDLMVVEFCDTADAGGWYRKYGAFCVDGRIVPRSLNYGQRWMLKFGGNEFSQAMAEEELEYVSTNPHEPELSEIFRISGIDYGRIDYSMLDGRVQTWEINNNPTIGRGLRPSHREIDPILDDVRQKAKEVFYSEFNAAWAAVAADSPGGGLSATTSKIDPIVIASARADVRRRWRTRKGVIRAGVRMARPLLRTPLAPMLRMIYRLPERIVQRSAAPLFRRLARRARR